MAEDRTDSGTFEDPRGSARRGPLGRMLGDSFGELNQLLRLLPELAHHLKQISRFTESMATEVRGMHAAVVRLEHEMQGLREEVAGIDDRMAAIEAGMDRLEPYIADVNLAVRPLKRARARLPHRSAAADGTDALPADDVAGPSGDPLRPV